MRFVQQFRCDCGSELSFYAHGDADWSSTVCPTCGKSSGVLDPLSVSQTATRLLYRTKSELESGDYSISIILSAMAVESFLTSMFLKLKEIETLVTGFYLATPKEQENWEQLYPRSGGFAKPVDFVSKAISEKTFDNFVKCNSVAIRVMEGYPDVANISARDYFQRELFTRRNRIVHWGYTNSSKEEAELCQRLAISIFSILEEMDRERYKNLDREIILGTKCT